MRNASRATPVATPQSQSQQSEQKQKQKQLPDQTDHIITISTASLSDQLQEPPVKHYTQPATTTTGTGASTATGTGTGASAAAIAIGSGPSHPAPAAGGSLCRLSRLVSYQNNIADVQHRRGRRLHGLQLPLHPLQLFGWLVLLLFGLASYWVLIPAFHAPIQGPLYGLISGLYVVHIAAHLTALLTDPADKELRRVHRNDRIVPEFDRSKHGHVIENGRCHLCNIRTTTPRTKHCSVCNKCVGKFDHHCKWLNHCIGSRNYVAFLMCVVSAVVATLVIVAAVIGQIVLYYVQPDWLSFYWCNSRLDTTLESTDYINLTLSLSNGSMLLLDQDQEQQQQLEEEQLQLQLENLTTTLPTLLQNFTALLEQSTTGPQLNHTVTPLVAGIGLHETIYLLLLGVLGLLAAISAGLLLHLCFFHIYISFLGLTTYEYIRNHRQAQEAKAKQLLEQGKNGVHFNPNLPTVNHPSKLAATGTAQLYCCSSVPHPNQRQQQQPDTAADAQRLHCCASSREYHQARQAIYMCSLLQERRSSSSERSLQLDLDATRDAAPLRSFHCCSSYAAGSMQRRVSAAASVKAALEPATVRHQRAQRSAGYLQYTEQCTLCTFQLRSPLRGSGSAGGSSSTRTLASQTATPTSSASAAGNISKHQRWRRKWNCCASVPDSPDVPNDLLAALSYREHSKINASELPVQFIRSLNGGLELPQAANAANPELPLKAPRSSRLRHMLRLLGRYRRARCQRGAAGAGNHGVAAAEQHVAAIKQNQIRPLQLQPGRFYDNASSTTTTATPPPPISSPSRSGSSSSELSSELSSEPCTGHQELMLLPTSVIREDCVTTSYTLTLPPALPPPTRRKMPSASELAELAETLGFVTSHGHSTSPSPSPSQVASRQLPVGLGNVYRRQRRKHFLRTRSPTLSPIHESGLSNPTSPQPLRHSLAATSASSIASSNNAKCSPIVARSTATLVQNLCGLAGGAETLPKTASNSSLQSISSNSSST
ncbi:pneumococcal serine-rich repeat protein [Drosophila montana]|uniref:pneumococcal serine-rich repeat protein n=1 Tax=Drosophila montana TaxID=40370 RepID=UPI00313D4F74